MYLSMLLAAFAAVPDENYSCENIPVVHQSEFGTIWHQIPDASTWREEVRSLPTALPVSDPDRMGGARSVEKLDRCGVRWRAAKGFVVSDGMDAREEGKPWSWSSENCDDAAGADHSIFDGESRDSDLAYNTDAQKATVLIHTFGTYVNPLTQRAYSVPLGSCTGVKLAHRFTDGTVIHFGKKVLTAAHCVSYPDGNGYSREIEPSGIIVCAAGHMADQENPWCRTAQSVSVNQDYYDNASAFDEDFAVVTLPEPILGQNIGMPLTLKAQEQYEQFDARNLAHPAFERGFNPATGKPTCVEQRVDAEVGESTIDNPLRHVFPPVSFNVEFGAKELFREVIDPSKYYINSNGMLRTRFDSASGASGSPVYLCNVGHCSPELFGILAGVAGISPYRVLGPSVEIMGGFIDANL